MGIQLSQEERKEKLKKSPKLWARKLAEVVKKLQEMSPPDREPTFSLDYHGNY